VEGEDFSGANTKAKKQVPRSARDDTKARWRDELAATGAGQSEDCRYGGRVGRCLTEQGLEAGLGEMLVVGQGGLDALGFHDFEAGAIGQAPALIGGELIAAQGALKLR